MTNRRTLPLLIVMLAALGGCARYQIGAGSLFSPDVQTVYVPVFESTSFRRNLGERLTEAVIKEIEKQTPYKVVDSQDADSILAGKIVQDLKRVTINNGYDDPRANEISLVVQVSWIDRRGDIIRRERSLPIDPQLVTINETAEFVPEFGQSVTTAQQEAIVRTAELIVAMMETPW